MQVLYVIYGGNLIGAWHLRLDSHKKWRLLFNSWGKGVIGIAQLPAQKIADTLQQAPETWAGLCAQVPDCTDCPSLSVNYSRNREEKTAKSATNISVFWAGGAYCIILTIHNITNTATHHLSAPLRNTLKHTSFHAGYKGNHLSHLLSVALPCRKSNPITFFMGSGKKYKIIADNFCERHKVGHHGKYWGEWGSHKISLDSLVQ